ncbi:hypothetical protein H2198_007322 [Neophaeococcomyces mojaviensis]|uniref:Uncharacterized protein n=1 Tax=Neophaeococcomyces mojaviensis TaxID=3383035 RepID=A0ACC3A0C3_9EURO|nr:hypothetical protein H2198_007322 [Knufia sp. JES_112]
MAYATIPQADGARKLSSHLTPSPTLPELSHTPLSAAFEDLSNTLRTDHDPISSRIRVSDVLKSLTSSQHSSSSYEVVEEDDYEQSQITPRLPKRMSRMMDSDRATSPKDDTPVRTASISRHLPLHNPTPDLQSLQGAYLKNVERLEDSAERLSLADSMEEELQRMKMELRRIDSNRSRDSVSSGDKRHLSGPSNSIIGVNAAARSGGYSPAGYITSPVGSVRSQRGYSHKEARTSKSSHLSAALPEPEFEGRPLESAMVHSPPTHAFQPQHSSASQRSASVHSSNYDRPGTSASNDTYRQAQNLFNDFDGTHFSPYDEDPRSRRISLSHPPLARDSRAFKEAQPGQKMIYYPAPVPVMLNLPKRLSRGDWAVKEKRRTQALSQIPSEMRKSAAWLANADIEAEPEPEASHRRSNIPSQLRASAFFDAPGARTDIKLKHGSAVITLDNILDAAAHAPVSAFTDHPIVGHLGNEVYGPEPRHKKKVSGSEKKRKSSLSNILTNRKSSGAFSETRRMSQNLDNEVEIGEDDPERAAERSIAPGEDELVDGDKPEGHSDEEEGSDEEQEPQHQLGFLGAPTTLLAELQLRKAQQKLRNRTAANAFPGGMHSTLLELDAVTQLQQKSRKMKHVALAWEDQDAVDKANFDDEDVPLGVLFPEKNQQNHVNLNRPMGLMEKKELEENEPLSFRRARLRGEPYKPAPSPKPSPGIEEPAPALKLVGVNDEDEEEVEEETLAQRMKRMKEQKEKKRNSLADDIASQLGLDPEQIGGSKTPDMEVEETLAQRRKRLQAEAEKAQVNGIGNGNAGLKQKTSMGDLLRANPVGARSNERLASAESKVSLLMNKRDPSTSFVEHIQAAQPGTKAITSPPLGHNAPPYFPKQPLLGHGMQVGQQQQQRQAPQFSQYPQMNINMQGAQSVPNLNMMNMNNTYNVQQQQQQQYPYNNQFMNMSGMNLNTGMNNINMGNMNYNPMQMQMQMQMPYMAGYGAAPTYDAIGMGPPLNSQQRASIDRWRQGIA